MATSVLLNVKELHFVDTAVDEELWTAQARRQYGGGSLLCVRFGVVYGADKLDAKGGAKSTMSPRGLCGTTSPRKLLLEQRCIVWDEELPVSVDGSAPALVLELCGTPRQTAITVLARTVVDLSAWLHKRDSSVVSLHLTPTAPVTIDTVHAVIDIGLRLANAEPAKPTVEVPNARMFDSVSVSTTDLFFPPGILSTGSSHVVSNVVCVCNTSTANTLEVSFSYSEKGLIRCYPNTSLVLGPLQRGYMSVSWYPDEGGSPRTASPSPSPTSVQIIVEDYITRETLKPIDFYITKAHPRPEQLLAQPFHYWVNGVCVTNMHYPPEELPYIRAVLPVFMMHHTADNLQDHIVARDKDTGQVVSISNTTSSTTMSRPLPTSIQDMSERNCVALLTLGTLRGMPVPTRRSRGFRVCAICTDPLWSAMSTETTTAFVDTDGTLTLSGDLVFRKAAHEKGRMSPHNIRLNLLEINSVDDEVPIASAIIQLGRISEEMLRTFPLPFYVLETYSQYDALPNNGWLMKGVRLMLLMAE